MRRLLPGCFVHGDILARPAPRRHAGASSDPQAASCATRGACRRSPHHSPYVIDLTAQLIHLLYTRAYGEALHYDRGDLEDIYTIAQRYPVVFLPSHKSNLDHLVLQYALHENGHPPNHTAGGINMNFFPVGPLVRRSGVFFIRRTFKDNPVYKFVLQHYIDYLIEKRFTLEWYIEGGRSRSGKLLPPRFGLLANVVDAYRRGKARTCSDPGGDRLRPSRTSRTANTRRANRRRPAGSSTSSVVCRRASATSTSASASRSRSRRPSGRPIPSPRSTAHRTTPRSSTSRSRSSPSRSPSASTA